MDRADRPHQPILRHDRQTLGRRLVQPRIGRDDGDGRVGAGIAAGNIGGIVCEIGASCDTAETEAARRRRQATEFLPCSSGQAQNCAMSPMVV